MTPPHLTVPRLTAEERSHARKCMEAQLEFCKSDHETADWFEAPCTANDCAVARYAVELERELERTREKMGTLYEYSHPEDGTLCQYVAVHPAMWGRATEPTALFNRFDVEAWDVIREHVETVKRAWAAASPPSPEARDA